METLLQLLIEGRLLRWMVAAGVTVATRAAATAVVSGRKRAVAATGGVAKIVPEEREERCRGERRRKKEEEKGIIDAHSIPSVANATLAGNSRWVKSARPACWRRRRPADARNPSSGDCGRLVELQGTFTSKFDQFNFTKNADDISINDLLDGNFARHSNSYPEKAKKASNSNESNLLSIRKAASVLRKAPAKEDHLSISSFFTQGLPIYPPKVTLKKLGLSSKHDSGSISPPMPLMKGAHSGLPPFPWSFSSAAGSGKSTLSRSLCQGKWVRIGSNSCLMAGEGFCFSDLDLKIKEGVGLPFQETGGASCSSLTAIERCCSPSALVAAEILCEMAVPKADEKKKSMKVEHGGGVSKVAPPPMFRCSAPTEKRDATAVAAPGFRGKNWRN